MRRGGVEGQSLLANEVLLVAASDEAGGWLRDTGGWLPTRRDGLGGWLRRGGRLAATKREAGLTRREAACNDSSQ